MTGTALPEPLARLHAAARRQPWLGRFTLANRLLLAMAFLPTGLVKATNQRFTLLPVEHPVGFFFEAMYQTGPYWVFIGLCQVAAALLLLVPATAALGALLFLPIVTSIFLITVGVGFQGTTWVTGGMLLSVVYLICWDGDRVWAAGARILGRRSGGPPLLASAHPVERLGWVLGGCAGMALFLGTRGFVPGSLFGELLALGAAAAGLVALGGVLGMRRVRASGRAAIGVLAAAALLAAQPVGAAAQDGGLKLAVGDVGVGIGDVPRIDGLRFNFRDRDLERVRGLNATIWRPWEEADGVVRGVALGLPLTGAGEITGLALGAGVEVDGLFDGIGLGALGMGAGGSVRGLVAGGLGVGAGDDLTGVALGGLGVGAGDDLRGLAVGGLGLGAGGDANGVLAGGLGVGVGRDLVGITFGGLGVGAGGDIGGITVGGVGVGAGGDLVGVTVGGIGVGAGGRIRGLAVSGVGVGATFIEGVVVSGIGAGAEVVEGLVVAPGWVRLGEGGRLTGVSVSAFNDLRGRQRGLAIGLVNVARELHGVQIGLINIARNKDRFPVLPLVNWAR